MTRPALGHIKESGSACCLPKGIDHDDHRPGASGPASCQDDTNTLSQRRGGHCHYWAQLRQGCIIVVLSTSQAIDCVMDRTISRVARIRNIAPYQSRSGDNILPCQNRSRDNIPPCQNRSCNNTLPCRRWTGDNIPPARAGVVTISPPARAGLTQSTFCRDATVGADITNTIGLLASAEECPPARPGQLLSIPSISKSKCLL